MMKARCFMQVEFPDMKTADAAVKALSHEGKAGKRSKAKITKKKKLLAIDIEAMDVVALRATANAYMRALQVFRGIEDVRGVRR